jgi:hypothetical protein
MNTLYIYTTKSDRKKGNYKFGQTSNDALTRVNQQQTGNSELLELIYSIEVDDKIRDYDIHDGLVNDGFSRVGDGGNEWFSSFDSDEHSITTLLIILNKIKAPRTLKPFIPRFYQDYVKLLFEEKLNNNQLKINNNEKVDFALELAPRFGKTLFSLDLMNTTLKNNKFKIILLPTYVLTALSSFKKDFYGFNHFSENMIFVDDVTKINEYYNTNKILVIPISLHMEDFEEKLSFIKNLPPNEKVSFIDEADYGAHRQKSQKFINYLNCGLNIYMTGTGIERVINPLSNIEDNVIRWSYTDMLMVKSGEHPVQKQLPKKYTLESSIKSVDGIITPHFYRLSLDNVIKKFDSLPSEYRTNWTKLLSDITKSEGVLTNLVQSLFGVYNGDLIGLYDLNTCVERQVSMIFANTPDKKQQNLLLKLIQNALGDRYIVELINGDKTTNREAEEHAKQIINKAKRESKKVVFLSLDMASRSFSLSEIDTVMLFFDKGLYSSITQKISRVLTPGDKLDGNKKTHANIISLSLDPNREEINPIDEYLVYEGEKVETNELSDGIKRVLRSVQLFTNGHGNNIEIEIDEYTERLMNSSSLIRMGSETCKVDRIINDNRLISELLNINISKSEKEKILGIDSSTVQIYEPSNKSKSKVDTEKEQKIFENNISKIKEILKNIVENIVEISEINNCESDNIINTLEMIKSKGYDEEVVFEVGIGCDVVKDVILSGAISHKLLNTIIASYNKEKVVFF